MTLHVETYHDLYEKAPCGYLTLSADCRIIAANQTFAAWIGRTADALVGQRFLDLLPLAGKVIFETRLSILLHLQNGFSEVALDFLAAGRDPVPTLVNAIQHRNGGESGRLTHLTIFNATERRRYEQDLLAARNELTQINAQLRDANARLDAANTSLASTLGELHALYEALPLGIFSTDSAGQVIHANGRFHDLLAPGASTDWLGSIGPDDVAAVSGAWTEALRSRSPLSVHFTAQGGASGPRHIELTTVCVPAPGEDGKRFVGFADDVTDRLKAESDSRQADRDAAVRQLTSGLAHHLNNLLSVTMGNLEFLEQGTALSDVQRAVLGDGLVGLERAASIVKRLLVYSGQGFVKPAGLHADAVLATAREKFAKRMGPGHALTLHLGCDGAELRIDQEMLETAIGELIANAVDAMPAGGEILCSSRLQAGTTGSPSSLIIEVADTGAGMDPATIARAREPFFSHKPGQRLGLGLSLVDGIARLFGGELQFESHPGNGTTAQLTFPLH